MGADMTLYCAPACDLTPPRIEQIKEVIRAIPDDDEGLCELMDDLGYRDAEHTRQCIIDRCQASQSEDREIVTLTLPGCPYQVRAAGGLTWGDPPSAAYTVLMHVEHCPQAWQILEQFAREDLNAASAPPSD